ncbi:uncharacterized protein LOC112452699 [Temnothorax curvispinosus]|uniref:Uncharacterized protein LOC112452699 n=1 Tax=Temnothorax curvispinosus TaxID=300111 RepID=A0A6J1PGY8_9HYME|nr:uncharacterized protein LOC112452699 [Temnothorax curvispinosus]
MQRSRGRLAYIFRFRILPHLLLYRTLDELRVFPIDDDGECLPEDEQDLFNRKLNRPACRVFSARSKLPFVSYSKKFCVRKSSITSARNSQVQAQKIVVRHKCIMLFQRMLTYFFIALAL